MQIKSLKNGIILLFCAICSVLRGQFTTFLQALFVYGVDGGFGVAVAGANEHRVRHGIHINLLVTGFYADAGMHECMYLTVMPPGIRNSSH